MSLSLGDWPVWLSLLITVTLVISKLAETSDKVVKALGPLGRGLRAAHTRRTVRRTEEFEQEVRRVATQLAPQLVPADYEVIKGQLSHVMDRVMTLEIENAAFRSYIVYEENWYFRAKLTVTKFGPECDLPDRLGWEDFLSRYKTGWRPD